MRKILVLCCLLAGLIASLLSVSCSSEGNKQKSEQTKDKETKELESKLRGDLAAKYGASVDWYKRVDGMIPYSVEMEEALIGSPKREGLEGDKRILFVAHVKDLIKKG